MTTWDEVPETTAVTSNPAAGVISVDVKTFTGRGRVTYVYCSCVADATVGNRYLVAQKISGAMTVQMAQGAAFAASATGALISAIGYTATQSALYPALAEIQFAPGDILRVILSNGQAGDDMSAITYSFKEML